MATVDQRSEIEAQIQFLQQVDQLKLVLRQAPLMDNSRRENSAEHSWHVALAALILAHQANAAIDVCRVIKMLLIHDIVEIDAGDTFSYDAARRLDQSEREEVAAQRLFGMLPSDQHDELRSLWDEFEARSTAEAKYAHAVDRLIPVLQNFATEGGSWRRHRVDRGRVVQRVEVIADGSAALWGYVSALLDDAVRQGFLEEAP